MDFQRVTILASGRVNVVFFVAYQFLCLTAAMICFYDLIYLALIFLNNNDVLRTEIALVIPIDQLAIPGVKHPTPYNVFEPLLLIVLLKPRNVKVTWKLAAKILN